MKPRKHSINSGGAEKDQRPIKWRGDKFRIPLVVRDTPHTPPAVMIDSPPYHCAKINESWLIHLLGALDSLTQLDAWSQDAEWAIAEIEKLANQMVAGECEENTMSFQLRQNPTKKCVLEQSLDGGLSWSLAFDYSKCIKPSDRILIQNTYNESYTEYNDILNQYEIDNSVNTFAPSLVFTGNPVVDDSKGIALCVACRAIVDSCCQMVIEERNDSAGVAGVVAGVGGIVAGLIAIFGSAVFPPSVPLWIGIGTGLGGVAGSIFAGVSDEVLSNETARYNVACCMANVMKGQTPSFTLFENSLSSCGFASGTAESQIAGAIAPLLGDENIFALWLRYTDTLVRQAELGLITCPCVPEPDPITVYTVASVMTDLLTGIETSINSTSYTDWKPVNVIPNRAYRFVSFQPDAICSFTGLNGCVNGSVPVRVFCQTPAILRVFSAGSCALTETTNGVWVQDSQVNVMTTTCEVQFEGIV